MLDAFPAMLVRLRSQRELSQREAAAELGISQALLSHYENGIREPRLEFLVRLCDYYDVSADFLLGRSRDDSSQALRKLVCSIEKLADEASQLITRPATALDDEGEEFKSR